ncbi:ComEC/Rec2 family competence protein [Candidatus Babeliales bacterium]|nr:ComEC/Rec2 family competence protein [Candidatus Babeliales bacterium]
MTLITLNKLSPFFLPLLSFILGIYWQSRFCFDFGVLIILLIILFTLLVLLETTYIKYVKYSELIIYYLFFISGALLYQAQINKNYFLLNKLKNKNINIIARVKDKEDVENNNSKKEILKLQVIKTQKLTQLNFKETNFNLLCYTNTPTTTRVGDTVLIKNIFLKNQKNNNINNKSPTFSDYLIKENILCSFFIKNLDYQILSSPYFNVNRWIHDKKITVYKNLKQKVLCKTFCFFSSIFLGNRKECTVNKFKNQFCLWGISHYLARAGLHIALLIFIWSIILFFLPINIYIKRIFLLLICLIYNLFSWTSISFVRALYLFFILQSGKILDQQTNFLHSLALICLIILLFNPIQLFFLDFQLSFALTFALAIPLNGLNKT